MVILNREDRQNFCFYVYDIRRNQFIRKIPKKSVEQQAFCLDHTGRILGFVDDEQMYLKMCRIPNSKALNTELRPRHKVYKRSMTCTEICEAKVTFRERIYRDMYFYHLFKKSMRQAEKESKMTEEQNMHLLVRKYEEACAEPFKLRANREFLML